MMIIILLPTVLVLLSLDQPLLPLWVSITTVSRATEELLNLIPTTLTTRYGMEQAVFTITITAVPMLACHGSTENFLQHKMKTLRSGSALIKHTLMKVF